MKPKAIVKLKTKDKTFTWESGDGILVSGSVSLQEGKSASNMQIELFDHRLELANSLPVPYKNSRTPIEVWLGYGAGLPKIFTGYIASLEGSGPPSKLILRAVDKAKGLRRVPKSRNLTDSNAEAAISKLVKEAGFKIDLSGSDLKQVAWSGWLQMGESDWAVISSITDSLGHEAFVRGDTVFVKKVGAVNDKVLAVQYGESISSFSFQVDELRSKTTPNAFDRKGARIFQSDSDVDLESATRATRLVNTGLVSGNFDQPEFTEQTKQRALKAQAKAKKLFSGSLTFTKAYPELDVDWQMLLSGFGPRFSGAWNVSDVSHDLVTGMTKANIYNGGSSV